MHSRADIGGVRRIDPDLCPCHYGFGWFRSAGALSIPTSRSPTLRYALHLFLVLSTSPLIFSTSPSSSHLPLVSSCSSTLASCFPHRRRVRIASVTLLGFIVELCASWLGCTPHRTPALGLGWDLHVLAWFEVGRGSQLSRCCCRRPHRFHRRPRRYAFKGVQWRVTER